MLDTCLIDLDGTLVDSLDRFHGAFNHALAKRGRDPLSREAFQTRMLAGTLLPLPDECSSQGQEVWRDVMAAFVAARNGSRELPGAVASVRALRERGLLLALTTGRVCQREVLRDELRHYGLEQMFASIFHPVDGVELDSGGYQTKTSVFRMACRQMNRRPQECALVSDWPHDIEEGAAFGFHLCVGVGTGGYARTAFPKGEGMVYLDSIADLPFWFARADRPSGTTLLLPFDYRRLTTRLVLRPPCAGDIEEMNRLASGGINTEWLRWNAHVGMHETRAFLEHLVAAWRLGEHYLFLIEDRVSSRLLGWCGLDEINWQGRRAHLGYCLAREYEGHGYMTEAVASLIAMASDVLDLETIYTAVWDGNTGSRRVLEKLAFRYDGVKPRSAFKANRCFDVHEYSYSLATQQKSWRAND